MRYIIQGLDGIDREVSKFEYMMNVWIFRVMLGFLGAVAVMMMIVALILMFQMFKELL